MATQISYVTLQLRALIILICALLILSAMPSQSRKNSNGSSSGSCNSSRRLQGSDPPSPDACNTDTGAECCTSSKSYAIFDCSPAVSSATPAILTLNDFTDGGDGGGASSCEDKFYDNTEPVVALSTGWFDNRSRCSKMIKITAKSTGKSVLALVVDECDSENGCDEEHGFQPPCRNNIVDGSAAVWDALGVRKDQQGDDLSITWSRAFDLSASPFLGFISVLMYLSLY